MQRFRKCSIAPRPNHQPIPRHILIALVLLLTLSCAICLSPQLNKITSNFYVDGENGVKRRDVLTLAVSSATILLPSTKIVASSSSSSSSSLSHEFQSNSVLLPLNSYELDGDNRIRFPLASFGLQVYNNDMAYKLTRIAIDVGYRNFFASVLAGNQRGFAKAVKDSGVPRSDLFICGSVVSNRVQGYDAAYQQTTKGWKSNMEEFSFGDIDYLDQILLDYPGPDCPSIRGQWKAFEDMYNKKLTRSLAVSNFSPAQLDCILLHEDTTVRPVVNQLPFSVAYHKGGSDLIIEENKKRNILVQAWAPLGGTLGRFDSTIKSKCAQIGLKYGNKSYAQVALRWIIQKGASFTTQSKNMDHFIDDLNVFDFVLSDQDMALLDNLV